MAHNMFYAKPSRYFGCAIATSIINYQNFYTVESGDRTWNRLYGVR